MVALQVLEERESISIKNFFSQDDTLKKIIEQQLDNKFYTYALRELDKFGERCAKVIDERASHTDRTGEPKLLRYDKFGEEVSEVWVNEGYKQTVDETYRTGIVGYVHKPIPELNKKGNYTYSFAQGYLLSHAEPGFYCPVTLTMATAYLLDNYANDEVKQKFLPHVCATGDLPLFEGATFLTERQGGSDVGANVVRAVKDHDTYRLYGEKYFASNAGMAGVAMVLARIEGAEKGTRGLSLFAVPWKDDTGQLNHVRIRKLKDKLGVRAVPSGEVEFDGAKAYLIGDPSKGFYYMMEALNLSRICNAVASIGIMRRSLLEAHAYTSRRDAFGKRLTSYPMVQHTLGTMASKLHAEVATIFDVIALYEKVTSKQATEQEMLLHRLFIAIMKKESAEQAIHFAHEAIELHGGNGYIEDFVTPRLLRDAQVLTVWEGTENILALELVRLIRKYQVHELFFHEMTSRIKNVQQHQLAAIISQIAQEIEEETLIFAALDEAQQTFEAKGLMKKFAQFYESVVTLQWASRYGGKFEQLAEVYIEETWALRKMGDEMKTVKYFDRLL